jgi:hypothetical protein
MLKNIDIYNLAGQKVLQTTAHNFSLMNKPTEIYVVVARTQAGEFLSFKILND